MMPFAGCEIGSRRLWLLTVKSAPQREVMSDHLLTAYCYGTR